MVREAESNTIFHTKKRFIYRKVIVLALSTVQEQTLYHAPVHNFLNIISLNFTKQAKILSRECNMHTDLYKTIYILIFSIINIHVSMVSNSSDPKRT